MFKSLDDLLSQEVTEESWYDDGFLIAKDIMNDFTANDWEELADNIDDKDIEWKKKLIYSVDNQLIWEELLIIGKAINTDDEELFEMCIDSLRSYDKEDIRRFLDEHKDVKSKLNDISNDSSGIIKSIVDSLLNKLSE